MQMILVKENKIQLVAKRVIHVCGHSIKVKESASRKILTALSFLQNQIAIIIFSVFLRKVEMDTATINPLIIATNS